MGKTYLTLTRILVKYNLHNEIMLFLNLGSEISPVKVEQWKKTMKGARVFDSVCEN